MVTSNHGGKPENRTKTGRFAAGTSGNPGGRPRRTAKELEVLGCIRGLSALAPVVLEDLLRDKTANPACRLKAAEIVLERTYGKPVASVQVETRPDVLAEIRAEVEKIKEETKE